MKTVVHLSDLHFGRDDPAVVRALIDSVVRIDPDVVAVSGDLTQRARRRQFRRARAFLDALPFPRVVVPGNHDVPLFNLLARFIDPLRGYRRAIAHDLEPVYRDEGLVVAGMDTTHPSTWKDGRIHQRAVARICGIAQDGDARAVTVLVAHHPFEDQPALEALIGCGVDVFLTGHLHVSTTTHTASRYRTATRSAVVVEAGTAASTRLREQTNAFNVLRLSQAAITVERRDWRPVGFVTADEQHFLRTPAGWIGGEPY